MGLQVLKSGVSFGAASIIAFMWLLPSVTTHVYNQHILGFEGFPFPSAAIPVTGKVLAILFDVIIVDMFNKLILSFALYFTFFPVAGQVPLFLLRLIVFSFII